jgi:hypothetical protein
VVETITFSLAAQLKLIIVLIQLACSNGQFHNQMQMHTLLLVLARFLTQCCCFVYSFATMTWELVSDGLGDSSKAQWEPVDPNDWTQGITSFSTDIAYDYDQCNADPNTNSFKVTYKCIEGSDTVTVVQEPQAGKNGPCVFEFVVDSSVVCQYAGGSSSTGAAVSSSSGPQPTSVPPISQTCHHLAPSYTAPFDLSSQPVLVANSVVFEDAHYYIQSCGSVDTLYCPYSGGSQQWSANTNTPQLLSHSASKDFSLT